MTWACVACTADNSNDSASSCAVCETPRRGFTPSGPAPSAPPPPPSSSSSVPSNSSTWACDCGARTSSLSWLCHACGMPQALGGEDETKESFDSAFGGAASGGSAGAGSSTSSWACSTCTFLNHASLPACEGCGLTRSSRPAVPAPAPAPVPAPTPTADLYVDMWICGRCTKQNLLSIKTCKCGRSFPSPAAAENASIRLLLKEAEDEVDRLHAQIARLREELSKQFISNETELEKVKEEAAATVASNKQYAGLAPLPGEREFLSAYHRGLHSRGDLFSVSLFPSRRVDPKNVGALHFAAAEAAFLRALASVGGTAYHVAKVEYIVNPPLVAAFQRRRHKLASQGRPATHTLAFHGTSGSAIDSITKENFRLPAPGYRGSYGAGVYFSERGSTALNYATSRGGGTGGGTIRLLLSQVLLGKVYTCPSRMPGAKLRGGFDSHSSPDGNEIVVFHQESILPCYILHVKAGPSPSASEPLVPASSYTPPRRRRHRYGYY